MFLAFVLVVVRCIVYVAAFTAYARYVCILVAYSSWSRCFGAQSNLVLASFPIWTFSTVKIMIYDDVNFIRWWIRVCANADRHTVVAATYTISHAFVSGWRWKRDGGKNDTTFFFVRQFITSERSSNELMAGSRQGVLDALFFLLSRILIYAVDFKVSSIPFLFRRFFIIIFGAAYCVTWMLSRFVNNDDEHDGSRVVLAAAAVTHSH